MALTVQGLERSFTFKRGTQEITLADPDPTMDPKAVMSFYSAQYYELTQTSIEGPAIKDDRCVYTFVTRVGTKG